MPNTLADITAEAQRILAEAKARSLPVRLIGGVAIKLHTNGVPPKALVREFKDIDLVTSRGKLGDVTDLIVTLGYTPANRFNSLNSGRRALFYDLAHERQLDLFGGSFEMCHKIPVTERLHVDPDTVPLAELLLTKLQIIELNEKDLQDTLALLVAHEIADHDADAINTDRIAQLCGGDWGLWRTCKENIHRIRSGIGRFDLAEHERALIDARLQSIWEEIDAIPKSRRWRLRDRIGDRVRWYEVPEEVG